MRAEWVRRAVQVAQGHNRSAAASVDFVSDDLLLNIARQVYQGNNVAGLPKREPDPSNPFVRQGCPGIMLADKYD